jgi:hypothetical protein
VVEKNEAAPDAANLGCVRGGCHLKRFSGGYIRQRMQVKDMAHAPKKSTDA